MTRGGREVQTRGFSCWCAAWQGLLAGRVSRVLGYSVRGAGRQGSVASGVQEGSLVGVLDDKEKQS